MAVVQEAFDIPEAIMEKICTGEYNRVGSVVRYAIGPQKGQIVKHLKPIELQAMEQVQSAGTEPLQFNQNSKKALIALGTATALARICRKMKNREPEVVVNFKTVLKEYIRSIHAGKMNVEVINRLIVLLNELKKHEDYEKISIKLSTEELDILVNRICEYTTKLAKDNSVKLSDKEKVDTGNAIVNLQKYLKVQKRIFEAA